jgi:tetratricopeptide (TPR) repeat protein
MKQFSLSETARILDTTEAQVRAFARMAEVGEPRDPGHGLEFTFQNLLVLKTTKSLLDSGVPARRMRRIWSSLRRQLADDLPLSSITIFADGDRAVAWDGQAQWQPDSGQFLLNFDAAEIAERAGESIASLSGSGGDDREAAAARAPTSAPTATVAPALTAEHWFHLASELEATSPREARQAYIHALEIDPEFADAHVNLGRQYHEAGELGKAEAHYRDALRLDPGDATAHFNLGVLLEDRQRPDEAVHAYEQAIARDPELADAYYNLGLLLEKQRRRPEALKHLMAARALYDRAEGDG